METEASTSLDVDQRFVGFRDEIDADFQVKEEIREAVRVLEEKGRDILALMQKAHPPADVSKILVNVDIALKQQVAPLYADLAKKVPAGQYYKLAKIVDEIVQYNDHYRFVNQRMSFLAAFLVFLKENEIATWQQVAELLGLTEDRNSQNFHLELEDYLYGLLMLASELARFSVNSVTEGDYSRPVQIHAFLAQLDGGFRLLNLKNDSLRKKFDALKYDMQKVEHVVYDLTIRGLKPNQESIAK